MIVLHAGFSENRLCLWGETPVDSGAQPPGRGRRPGKGASPPILPYDAGAERLTWALEAAGLPAPAGKIQVDTVIAWLPTLDKQHLASSPLIGNPPDAPGAPTLAPWRITVLPLPD